jgi:hypothetical protein
VIILFIDIVKIVENTEEDEKGAPFSDYPMSIKSSSYQN